MPFFSFLVVYLIQCVGFWTLPHAMKAWDRSNIFIIKLYHSTQTGRKCKKNRASTVFVKNIYYSQYYYSFISISINLTKNLDWSEFITNWSIDWSCWVEFNLPNLLSLLMITPSTHAHAMHVFRWFLFWMSFFSWV